MSSQPYYDTLLLTPREIKSAATVISANMDETYLKTATQTVQEIYLENLVGQSLVRTLQELIYNENKKDTVDPDTPRITDIDHVPYFILWEDYIKPYMKARVQVDILYMSAYKVRNAGVVRISDTGVQPAPMDDIKYLERQYLTYVAEYEKRLVEYLKNSKSLFPEYGGCGSAAADINGSNYANTGGLWLGGHGRKCCKKG